MEDNKYTITDEELERLPIKKLTTGSGGTQQYVRYDEESGIAYLLDSKMKYTGRASNIKGSLMQKSEAQTPSVQSKKEDKDPKPKRSTVKAAKKEKNPPDVTDPEAELEANARKKKLLGFGLLGLAGIGLLLYLLSILGILNPSGPASNKPKPTTPADPAAVDIKDLAAAEKYNVLIFTRNMFQGDVITEEDLATFEMSKAEFAVCGGAYTLACKDAVIGMELTRFMPFGSVAVYDSCAAKSSFQISPWSSLPAGQSYLDVPVSLVLKDLSAVIPGDYVDLTISVNTTRSQDSEEAASNTDGMEHTSAVSASTTTDTYRFARICVADIILQDGTSFYATISRLFTVPDGFLPAVLRDEYNAETIGNLVPKYYRFVVTDAQLSEIGTMPPEATSVDAVMLEESQNPYFQNFSSRTDYIVSLICRRSEEIQQEADNE
jgi:hypothetical protein